MLIAELNSQTSVCSYCGLLIHHHFLKPNNIHNILPLIISVNYLPQVSVPENYLLLEEAFNSTTSFGRLHSCEGTVAGRNVYLRFSCMSGDAMGMNMVSKGARLCFVVLIVVI